MMLGKTIEYHDIIFPEVMATMEEEQFINN